MNDSTARILVVDDEEANLALVLEVLHAASYTTVSARDGLEALDKFEKYQPDLVVLDLMMPRLDGLEVCSRIRHRGHHQDVPILMMTGLDELDIKRRALDVGIDDLLFKPIEPRELQLRVRALLQLRRCDQCHARQDADLARARQGFADLDRQLAQLADQPGLAAVRDACHRLTQQL